MARVSLSLALLYALALLAACSGGEVEARRGPGPLSFQDLQGAFLTVDTIYLEDAPGDTIAEIGDVDMSPNGEMLIADRYLPRVRLYTSEGRFVAGQGRFGDAPFEYRRVESVARSRDGSVFVHELRGSKVTVLSPPLLPDTTFQPDSGFSGTNLLQRFRGGIVQGLYGIEGRSWFVYRDSLGIQRWKLRAGPERIFVVPYWSSVARFLMADAGDTLIVGNSLLYPLRLYNAGGVVIGELGSPPPSYRRVPEVERGAFAFTGEAAGGMVHSLGEWLASFTVIAGLHVVQGRWLVVSHGRISTDPPLPPWETIEYAVDMYDLRSGLKVLEDIPLPEGARVLGGGPYLHVLVDIPPQPWTVLRLDVRPEIKERS